MPSEWITVTGIPGTLQARFSEEKEAIEAAERHVVSQGGTCYIFKLVETVQAIAHRKLHQ